jgi:hypothetical protein
MEQSYFSEQADRCRRLARHSTDPVLQVSLRKSNMVRCEVMGQFDCGSDDALELVRFERIFPR